MFATVILWQGKGEKYGARRYVYSTSMNLHVGDIVTVPVRDGEWKKARVVDVNVPAPPFTVKEIITLGFAEQDAEQDAEPDAEQEDKKMTEAENAEGK